MKYACMHALEKRVMPCAAGLLALLCSLFWPGLGCGLAMAAPETSAAMVLAVTPDVWVERGTEKIPLVPKMDLKVGDTVVSNATGKAQLLFADDSAVTLSPSTSLRVADFVYDPSGEGGDDTVLLNLGAGMARFLTGEVARRNPGGVAVHTLHATIGIRGTTFTVRETGDLTTAVLLETSGAGLEVTNLATGAVTPLSTVGNALDVGPTGSWERPATPGEMAASSQGTRNVGTTAPNGGTPAGTLHAGASGGLGPAGPADDSPLALFGAPAMQPADNVFPGLDISAIRGTFGAPIAGTANLGGEETFFYTGSASFEVDGMANISNGQILLNMTDGYFPLGSPSATGGTGTIAAGGAFAVGGFTLSTGTGNSPQSASMDGQFHTESSGTLNWNMGIKNNDGVPLGVVQGDNVPFGK